MLVQLSFYSPNSTSWKSCRRSQGGRSRSPRREKKPCGPPCRASSFTQPLRGGSQAFASTSQLKTSCDSQPCARGFSRGWTSVFRANSSKEHRWAERQNARGFRRRDSDPQDESHPGGDQGWSLFAYGLPRRMCCRTFQFLPGREARTGTSGRWAPALP